MLRCPLWLPSNRQSAAEWSIDGFRVCCSSLDPLYDRWHSGTSCALPSFGAPFCMHRTSTTDQSLHHLPYLTFKSSLLAPPLYERRAAQMLSWEVAQCTTVHPKRLHAWCPPHSVWKYTPLNPDGTPAPAKWWWFPQNGCLVTFVKNCGRLYDRSFLLFCVTWAPFVDPRRRQKKKKILSC